MPTETEMDEWVLRLGVTVCSLGPGVPNRDTCVLRCNRPWFVSYGHRRLAHRGHYLVVSNENRSKIFIVADLFAAGASPQVPHSHHSCPLSLAMLTTKFAYLWEMYTWTPLMESSFTETEMDEWVLELG